MSRICDYEGSQYRTEFWDQDRIYEDGAERIAMKHLLPPTGKRLIEVGAGFGRLTDLYQGYDQIVLTDYARTQIQEAQDYIGPDDRFSYVVADVYKMPFAAHSFDALTMVRVMHHLTDVPEALAELNRILIPGATAVIEYANKRNLKAMLRWLLGRQKWNPFDMVPIEFVELNFNFHPSWIQQQFRTAGFEITNQRTVSHYRLNLLKKLLPSAWLIQLDGWTQPTGQWFQFSPSVFLQTQVQKTARTPTPDTSFCCPTCNNIDLIHKKSPPEFPEGDLLICESCQVGWRFQDGIYDFKTPLSLKNSSGDLS